MNYNQSPLSRDSVRETKRKERSSFTREDNTRFSEDTILISDEVRTK